MTVRENLQDGQGTTKAEFSGGGLKYFRRDLSVGVWFFETARPAARDLMGRMGRDVILGRYCPRINAMLLTQQRGAGGGAAIKRFILVHCHQTRGIEKRKESLARPGVAGTRDAESTERGKLPFRRYRLAAPFFIRQDLRDGRD